MNIKHFLPIILELLEKEKKINVIECSLEFHLQSFNNLKIISNHYGIAAPTSCFKNKFCKIFQCSHKFLNLHNETNRLDDHLLKFISQVESLQIQ